MNDWLSLNRELFQSASLLVVAVAVLVQCVINARLVRKLYALEFRIAHLENVRKERR